MLGLEEPGKPLTVGGPERFRHDQVSHVRAHRLVGPIPERRLGGVVPAEDVPAVIHRHDRVERRLQHRPQARLAGTHLFLGMPSRDELTDFAAQRAHRPEQLLVRLARLA